MMMAGGGAAALLKPAGLARTSSRTPEVSDQFQVPPNTSLLGIGAGREAARRLSVDNTTARRSARTSTQHHHPQHRVPGAAGLLAGVGSDRHVDRQLERRASTGIRSSPGATSGRSLHVHDGVHIGHAGADAVSMQATCSGRTGLDIEDGSDEYHLVQHLQQHDKTR